MKGLCNENIRDSKERYCQKCNQEKQKIFCKKCNKKTLSRFEVFISDSARVEVSLGIVQKESGIKKWIRKTFQGFQKSNDSEKHPQGVYVKRDIHKSSL
jgi:endo-1,4-beta-D-glucanase Y